VRQGVEVAGIKIQRGKKLRHSSDPEAGGGSKQGGKGPKDSRVFNVAKKDGFGR